MWLRFVPSLLLAAAGCASMNADASKSLAEGRWGGQHVTMDVTSASVAFQFDCATGSIDRRVELDANGSFDVGGTLARQTPGPVRQGGSDNVVSVRYVGEVKGDAMSLRIMSNDGKEQIETFTLAFGQEGKIFRCL